jgi:hypothetical protein
LLSLSTAMGKMDYSKENFPCGNTTKFKKSEGHEG